MAAHDTRYATAHQATVITCPFCNRLVGLALPPKQVAVADEVFCYECKLSLVIESVQALPGGMVVGVRQRFPWERGAGADTESKADEVGEESKETEAASGAD